MPAPVVASGDRVVAESRIVDIDGNSVVTGTPIAVVVCSLLVGLVVVVVVEVVVVVVV